MKKFIVFSLVLSFFAVAGANFVKANSYDDCKAACIANGGNKADCKKQCGYDPNKA